MSWFDKRQSSFVTPNKKFDKSASVKHGCVYATTTTPGLLFYIPAQCKQS